MRTLFPSVQPEVIEPKPLPIYRDVAWDMAENHAVWQGGSPVIVEGLAAVRSWAHRALQVERYRYAGYSWDYGNECTELIGSRGGAITPSGTPIRAFCFPALIAPD